MSQKHNIAVTYQKGNCLLKYVRKSFKEKLSNRILEDNEMELDRGHRHFWVSDVEFCTWST